MTYKELYQEITSPHKTEVSFPYSYKEGEDLLDCYNRLFKKYTEILSQVDNLDSLKQDFQDYLDAHNALPDRDIDILRDVRELSEATFNCLCSCFDGFPSDAFINFKNFFAENSFYHFNSFPRLILYPRMSFYRVRKKEKEDFTGKYGELFHIPFELRTRVSSKRFSIPGLPALYLSSSLNTACVETGIQKGDTFAYSRFENSDKLELLDLSFFNKNKHKDIWEYFSFFVNYPAIMACHIPVKCSNDPFKPEYCIPQIFTQLIRNIDAIDGIAYLSTKQIDSLEYGFEKTNFILPATNVSTKKGFCKTLMNSFKMTSPVEIPTSLKLDDRNFYEESDDFKVLPLITAPGICEEINLPFDL